MENNNSSKYVVGIKTKELNFKSLANLAILLDKMDMNKNSIALDLKEVETVTEDFFTFIKNFSEIIAN